MLDRITSLQVFLRVAHLGGFSAAARALGLSQTMATKHVDALEQRLGVRLLHRSTRRVTPTESGRRYMETAERILAELDEADEAIAADRVEPRGMLRLAAPLAFGTREIAPLLADFARRHPAVTVELGLSDRFVDLVDEGWDMAVRIGILKDSAMIARRLAPCRVTLCAAPAYLAARGTPRTLADLADHDALGYTLPTPATADRWLFGREGEIGVSVHARVRANNGDALLAAALAGHGLLYQPTFIAADAIRAGLLVPLTLDRPLMHGRSVYAVLPSGRNPPARVRAFVDFLAARYWPEPPWDRDLPPDG